MYFEVNDVRNINITLQTIPSCIRIRWGQKIISKVTLKSKMAAESAPSETRDTKI